MRKNEKERESEGNIRIGKMGGFKCTNKATFILVSALTFAGCEDILEFIIRCMLMAVPPDCG